MREPRRIQLEPHPDAVQPHAPAAGDVSHRPLNEREQLMSDAQWMANRVRAIYLRDHQHYFPRNRPLGAAPIPQWDGGYDTNSGRQFQPVWPKVARFVLEHGLNPNRLIRLVFRHTRRSRAPQPLEMITASAVGLYYAYSEDLLPRLRQERATQSTTLHGAIRIFRRAHPDWCELDCIQHAITSDFWAAGVLFRYCMAAAANFTRAAALYHDGALEEYLFERQAYDSAWQELIPETLRLEANAIMAAPARQEGIV